MLWLRPSAHSLSIFPLEALRKEHTGFFNVCHLLLTKLTVKLATNQSQPCGLLFTNLILLSYREGIFIFFMAVTKYIMPLLSGNTHKPFLLFLIKTSLSFLKCNQVKSLPRQIKWMGTHKTNLLWLSFDSVWLVSQFLKPAVKKKYMTFLLFRYDHNGNTSRNSDAAQGLPIIRW